MVVLCILLSHRRHNDIMGKSDSCTQDDHASCDGVIKTVIEGSDITKICACPCHDSSYQLVKKMFAVIKQDDG